MGVGRRERERKEVCSKEFAHVMMESEKSHDLCSAS